ncbi:MAG: hypothetical protein MUE85_19770 [Microscillaceae bacterium]|jgi:hypothetical protein|nr:hypothetical protein [Microscillaceae bacterium]
MNSVNKLKTALQRKEAHDVKQKQAEADFNARQAAQNQSADNQMEDLENEAFSYEYFEPENFEFAPQEIADIQEALKEEVKHWQFEFLPEQSNGVQVFRIKTPQVLSIPVLELSEGLEAKAVEIVEVNESGSVNELRVRNHSLQHLLIYEGSLLQGEKQNRIVNATLLLLPNSETIIPVSCVEQGRWSKQSYGFSKPNYDATSSMRHRLKKDIMAYKMGHKSSQSNIWKEVEEFSKLEDVSNATSDFADHYEKSRKERYIFKDGLKFSSHGVLARAQKADFIDFVSDEKAFTNILERVSKGYEFDKDDHADVEKLPDEYLLEIVGGEVKDVYVHTSVGLGYDVRLETNTHFINSLLVGDEFVSVSIARKPEFDYINY